LLLIQIALLLTVARFGSELAKRVGLPAVVGELASGIALGPSLFGRFMPSAFAAVFPPDVEQFHLLDVVGNLGMVLLLLLTGLETDLRLLRSLGRAASIASVLGMAIPFASGFGLGMLMPDAYVAQPDHRMLFSLFMATAMSISAMPVIAKILMDLGLTKRNIGLVIVSAGVVDDTAGWLVLSLIAGAATKGVVRIADLGKTVLGMVGFIAAVFLVVYPITRRLMGFVREMRTKDSDFVLIVVMALLCGAVTEHIGVHAVFGAFVAGTMLRQVPRLAHESVERLESFVFSILAPVFFGIVGLKVNLWAMGSPAMVAIVLGVACAGKLIGCSLGAWWGGLRLWESLSIAVAMNARGAMGLVVATIGLSLGILNQQTYSIIVVVAIVTSFMAPIGLRFTVPRVLMTEDEAQRIAESQSKLAFDIGKIRALLPTAGGEPSLGAAILTGALTKRSGNAIEVLHVGTSASLWQRVTRRFRQPERAIEDHLKAIKDLAVRADVRRVSTNDVPGAILDAARKGFDLLVLGAKDMGSALLADVVEGAPCHVVIFRAYEAPSKAYHRILVPIEGGAVSRVALEVAVRYAEAYEAELTLALMEQRPRAVSIVEPRGSDPSIPDMGPVSTSDLERMSGVFRTSKLRPEILRLGFDPTGSALGQAVERGGYDLVIVGAENRAIQHRLFFGYETERLLRKSALPIAIVVPNMAKLVG
jgi:Kef-type K+ transport system membrane component KefB